ncbi:DcrB-related protein [Burkholderia ubonensis]|nr:DcrB-related protein [Burkholderia ubonensis]
MQRSAICSHTSFSPPDGAGFSRHRITMPEYQMNDAAIELPARFQDKTMHLFTVDAAGASGFTFVVSRAPMEPEDTVDTFAERLVKEMRKTLPRFELKRLEVREIDGEAAREIDYQWVSDGTQLHQRQTVVMSPMPRKERVAISFIGTCPKAFTPEWSGEYDGLVSSVVLKRPDEPAFVPVPLAHDAAGVVFVLHDSSRTLYVLTGMAELYRHDVSEMFGDVAFFDAGGVPLALQAAPAGQPAWSAPDGRRFALWTSNPREHASLHERLGDVASVKGMTGMQTVAAVQAYLTNVGNTH